MITTSETGVPRRNAVSLLLDPDFERSNITASFILIPSFEYLPFDSNTRSKVSSLSDISVSQPPVINGLFETTRVTGDDHKIGNAPKAFARLFHILKFRLNALSAPSQMWVPQ